MSMKLLDLILQKDKDTKINTYYFGEYMPAIIEWDNKRVISRNTGDRVILLKGKNLEITSISYDYLIKNYNAKILGITKGLESTNVFKVDDITSLGVINDFPIINKILKVKIDEINYDVEILDKEIAPIIKTHDNIYIYDFGTTVYVLDLKELKSNTFIIGNPFYEILNYHYNLDNRYVIFKSRKNMKEYLEEYLLTN